MSPALLILWLWNFYKGTEKACEWRQVMVCSACRWGQVMVMVCSAWQFVGCFPLLYLAIEDTQVVSTVLGKMLFLFCELKITATWPAPLLLYSLRAELLQTILWFCWKSHPVRNSSGGQLYIVIDFIALFNHSKQFIMTEEVMIPLFPGADSQPSLMALDFWQSFLNQRILTYAKSLGAVFCSQKRRT